MVKYYVLDKAFSAGSSYTAEDNKFYKVYAEATDATSDIYIQVDQWSMPAVKDIVAPLRKRTANLLGPLDLGDRWISIPPRTPFRIVGPSGTYLRAIGEIGVLGPGEPVPAEVIERYHAQPKRQLVYLENVFSLGTDVSWGAGVEQTVYSITPTARERYICDSVVMIDVANVTLSPGDMGIIFMKDTERFDIFETGMGHLGVDALSMPRPPDSDNMEPFSLETHPVVLGPAETLSIIARNNTGAAWTPPAGTSISVTVTFVAKYDILE